MQRLLSDIFPSSRQAAGTFLYDRFLEAHAIIVNRDTPI